MIVRSPLRAYLGMALLGLVLSWPGQAAAQYTDSPAPAAYALEDVDIVHADGRRDDGVTIVVRGRFIEAIGRDITVPRDARVLDGEDLVVYPGLVDGHGKASYTFPRFEGDRRQVPAWDAPRELQGFTPHRRVVDVLESTGSDLSAQREQGVIAAAVHPTDAMMPGRGAFLLLRQSARSPAELVLEPELGPVMTFRGGQGAYPSTLFGVQAFYRQVLEDAGRHNTIVSEYERDPRGLTPPTYDPDHAVLNAAMAGDVPVYFYADGAEDIRRALDLTERFGLRLVILGGQSAWQVADRLAARDVPVLASVAFDSPRHWKPDADESGDAAGPAAGGSGASISVSAGTDPVILREQKRFEELYANAARLSEAGVRFALTSGGGEGELRKGVQKAIEYGLDEAAALRAVTSVPAELLGLPHLVRIEDGAPANFTVTTGPLFDEETDVAYTFVEGELEEVEAVSLGQAGGAEPPSVDVTGRWEIEMDSDAGLVSGTMTLNQSDASFTGTITMDQLGDLSIRSGRVSGNRLTFVIEVDMGGESLALEHEAAVDDDDEMTGSGTSSFGDVTFKATRSDGPGGTR